MLKPSFILAFCFLVASVAPTTSNAGWHHRYGCGSCGSHGHRWHGSHGSSGGCSGGSTGGCSGGATAAAPEAKPTPPAAGKTSSRVPPTGALLVLEVPEHAAVLINGQRTNLTGAVREFVADGLAENGRYEYEITMTVEEGSTRREVTKTVWLAAGTEQTLAFGSTGTASSRPTVSGTDANVITSLTLTVPADAEVWIAGQRTSAVGAVRRFSTGDIPTGESWSDYEVRVVTNSGGAERSVAKSITLHGGEAIELAIDPALPGPGVETTASTR